MASSPKTPRRPVLLAAAALAAGAAYALARRAHPPLPTVPHVDLHKYQGVWYEIARLPTRFEKGCQHVTAEYQLRADGEIRVVNTCRRGALHGPVATTTGTARAVDATNAKLKVRFFWPFEGDYWIIALDQSDYRYALVAGGPNRRSLWLLSRTPHLARNLRDQLIGRARALGFPVEKLLYTPQPIASQP